MSSKKKKSKDKKNIHEDIKKKSFQAQPEDIETMHKAENQQYEDITIVQDDEEIE